MIEFYSKDQLEVIFPYLENITPKWLVLGGPADGNEALTALKKWPTIRIVGVEPNPEAWRWQKENAWPKHHPLITNALADKCGDVELVREPGRIRNASADPDAVAANWDNSASRRFIVQATTLDTLEYSYGPFVDAVVWLDIEGSELKALQGAENLIASRRVLLWNIEMLSRVPGMMTEVPKLLNGYKAVKDWNASKECRDRIFVREDLL